MLRFPQRFVLSGLAFAVVVAVAPVAWGLATGSSAAQPGTMHNCPPAGKWSIAVWEGESGASADDALATCGAGTVAAAYSLEPQTGAWSRWFAGKPDVSNLAPLNDMQGVLALASATGPLATATPAATPTPSASVLPTLTPTASVGCVACLADLQACQDSADVQSCREDCILGHDQCQVDCIRGDNACWVDCYFDTWDCVGAASSLSSAWDCFTGCGYCNEDCGYCHEIWDCGYCFE